MPSTSIYYEAPIGHPSVYMVKRAAWLPSPRCPAWRPSWVRAGHLVCAVVLSNGLTRAWRGWGTLRPVAVQQGQQVCKVLAAQSLHRDTHRQGHWEIEFYYELMALMPVIRPQTQSIFPKISLALFEPGTQVLC